MAKECEWLITGAAGFSGSHHVDKLVQDGKNTVAAVRDRRNIPDLEKSLDSSRLTLAELDLTDQKAVHELIIRYKPHTLVHLAGQSLTSAFERDFVGEYQKDVALMFNLLDEIYQHSPETTVILTGSVLEHLLPPTPPPWLTDFSPSETRVNHYAMVKATEGMIGSQFLKMGVHIRKAVVFNHSGARRKETTFDGNLYKAAVKAKNAGGTWIVTVGSQDLTRDWQHVENWVKASITIATSGKDGEGYDICSGESYSTLDLVEAIASSLNLSYELIEDPRLLPTKQPSVMRGNNERLRLLGWEPEKTFEQMIEAGIAWHKAQLDK